MALLGAKRVWRVYSFWTLIYLILLGGMIYFQLRIPQVLFLLTLVFLVKTIFLDYNVLNVRRKRVYWMEHGPFHFLIGLIGIFDLIGFEYFSNFVNLPTTIFAIIGFFLDFIKDLKEDPSVYNK
ncbi:hypothetical protein COU60_03690 [Candidatus Pacearchaeota archaeon CG10_big_fil_rev_8_21_14_0_10_34_76]|nr:MAG: hypothetical protein COU60_03690 [Candidatus Pacearchaeota archaeon CG10_big_fil_rev_8_21_14_0_10_34_76]